MAQGLIELANGLGLPLVASNDVHYLTPDDKDAHDILLCIQTGSLVADTDRMRMEGEWYLKSPEEMAQAFDDQPDALANTVAIAERCDLDLPFGRIAMPSVDLPKGQTATSQLAQLATEGLARRIPNAGSKYRERLAYELDVIDQTDFGEYLLLVREIFAFARAQGMLTAPRGSVNGSLVAYATDMSDIDPIEHDIIFERFLTIGRKGSMPDVDMDFPSDRRDEVIEYMIRRFGADHVAQIVTFGTLAARAAVRDVGRVLGMEYGLTDRLAKLIPVNPVDPYTIGRSLDEVEELKSMYQGDDAVRRLLDSAQRIEGVARHALNPRRRTGGVERSAAGARAAYALGRRPASRTVHLSDHRKDWPAATGRAGAVQLPNDPARPAAGGAGHGPGVGAPGHPPGRRRGFCAAAAWPHGRRPSRWRAPG